MVKVEIKNGLAIIEGEDGNTYIASESPCSPGMFTDYSGNVKLYIQAKSNVELAMSYIQNFWSKTMKYRRFGWSLEDAADELLIARRGSSARTVDMYVLDQIKELKEGTINEYEVVFKGKLPSQGNGYTLIQGSLKEVYEDCYRGELTSKEIKYPTDHPLFSVLMKSMGKMRGRITSEGILIRLQDARFFLVTLPPIFDDNGEEITAPRSFEFSVGKNFKYGTRKRTADRSILYRAFPTPEGWAVETSRDQTARKVKSGLPARCVFGEEDEYSTIFKVMNGIRLELPKISVQVMGDSKK